MPSVICTRDESRLGMSFISVFGTGMRSHPEMRLPSLPHKFVGFGCNVGVSSKNVALTSFDLANSIKSHMYIHDLTSFDAHLEMGVPISSTM